MNPFRLVGALLVVVGLGFVVGEASCRQSAAPLEAPCDAAALAAAFHGQDMVESVQNFGCGGGFAYLWATIGTGVHAIGVTEVLKYDVETSAWRNVSRETYCFHHRLPDYVSFWGCNSN